MHPATAVRIVRAATCFLLFLLAASAWAQAQPSPLEETRRSAEQGDAEAQFSLGRMYDEGEGVAEDDAEAVRWYRLAAEHSKDEGRT